METVKNDDTSCGMNQSSLLLDDDELFQFPLLSSQGTSLQFTLSPRESCERAQIDSVDSTATLPAKKRTVAHMMHRRKTIPEAAQKYMAQKPDSSLLRQPCTPPKKVIAAKRSFSNGLERTRAVTLGKSALLHPGIATHSTRQKVNDPASHTSFDQQHTKVLPHPAGSSTDLVTKMAKRLAQLESSAKSTRVKLVDQERELIQLRHYKETHQMVTKSKGGITMDVSEAMTKLRERNEHLEMQLMDMKELLQDYGLVWKGGGMSNTHSEYSSMIDTKSLIAKLIQLNEAAAASQHRFSADNSKGNIVTLKHLDEPMISISVYSDGIMLGKGPMRPYSHPAAQSFVTDVLDGYFPSEFKDQFPDGIKFNVRDCSDETGPEGIVIGSAFKPFSGAGQQLSTLSDLTKGAKQTTSSIADVCNQGDERSNTVVGPTGTVVNVKNSLSELLHSITHPQQQQTSCTKLCGYETQNDCPIKCHDPIGKTSESCFGSMEVAMLRFKGDCIQGSLELHIPRSWTISQLRNLLDRQIHGTTTQYQIRTSFPRRVYSNPSETLEEAGLAPRANLILRNMTSSNEV